MGKKQRWFTVLPIIPESIRRWTSTAKSMYCCLADWQHTMPMTASFRDWQRNGSTMQRLVLALGSGTRKRKYRVIIYCAFLSFPNYHLCRRCIFFYPLFVFIHLLVSIMDQLRQILFRCICPGISHCNRDRNVTLFVSR